MSGSENIGVEPSFSIGTLFYLTTPPNQLLNSQKGSTNVYSYRYRELTSFLDVLLGENAWLGSQIGPSRGQF